MSPDDSILELGDLVVQRVERDRVVLAYAHAMTCVSAAIKRLSGLPPGSALLPAQSTGLKAGLNTAARAR